MRFSKYPKLSKYIQKYISRPFPNSFSLKTTLFLKRKKEPLFIVNEKEKENIWI